MVNYDLAKIKQDGTKTSSTCNIYAYRGMFVDDGESVLSCVKGGGVIFNVEVMCVMYTVTVIFIHLQQSANRNI